MKQRMLNLVTLASLLLCLALAALWVRSVGHFEQLNVWTVRWPAENEVRTLYVGFAWYSNTLRLRVTRHAYLPGYFRQYERSPAHMDSFRKSRPAGVRWHFSDDDETRAMNGYPPGFATRYSPSGEGSSARGGTWVLAVRPWLPAALTALLPALWMYRFWKARRAPRPGMCRTCGYDLRTTPERCPECGSVAVVAAGPAAESGGQPDELRAACRDEVRSGDARGASTVRPTSAAQP